MKEPDEVSLIFQLTLLCNGFINRTSKNLIDGLSTFFLCCNRGHLRAISVKSFNQLNDFVPVAHSLIGAQGKRCLFLDLFGSIKRQRIEEHVKILRCIKASDSIFIFSIS